MILVNPIGESNSFIGETKVLRSHTFLSLSYFLTPRIDIKLIRISFRTFDPEKSHNENESVRLTRSFK